MDTSLTVEYDKDADRAKNGVILIFRFCRVGQYAPDNPLNPANRYNPNTPFAPLNRLR